MRELTKKQIFLFQKKIFSWWKTNRRDLPWRYTHDPYKILVSEVMLQQTQVLRVVPKYKEFLSVFPDIQTLSRAPISKVLQVWKGMGYNRRALYLQKAAKLIVEAQNGVFPADRAKLNQLPGVGKYTASAIMVFAYKKDVAMVDTNIRKIITHFFFDNVKQPEKIIHTVANMLIPKGKSWEWHQALMDYGAGEMSKPNSLVGGQMPKLHLKIQKLKRSKITPFIETRRYFRGRIIDELRHSSYGVSKFIVLLTKKYGKTKEFYIEVINDLKKEGLLIKKGKTISLP